MISSKIISPKQKGLVTLYEIIREKQEPMFIVFFVQLTSYHKSFYAQSVNIKLASPQAALLSLFYGKITSVSPPRVTWNKDVRMHYWEDQKPSTRQDWNPRPLCYVACILLWLKKVRFFQPTSRTTWLPITARTRRRSGASFATSEPETRSSLRRTRSPTQVHF